MGGRVVVVLWDRRSTFLVILGLAGVVSLVFLLLRASTLVIAPPYDAVCGKVVVIDPGHGGPDPGATGRSGIAEKDIVLDIGRRLERMLNRVAVYTVMTRRKDEVLVGAGVDDTLYWRRAELEKRMELANGSGADLLISLHANSFPEPVWSGAQTFYHPRSEESSLLAAAIQKELASRLGPNLRRARPGESYFVLRNAKMPAVLVEVGFLSNPREEGLLGTPEYRERVAEAIFRGTVDYLVDRHKREAARSGEPPAPPRGAPVTIKTPGAGGYTMAVNEDQLVLYFAGPTNFDDSLLPELRDMGATFATASLKRKAAMAMAELIRGPAGQSMLCRTLPEGVSVEWMEVSGGQLTISLGSEIIRRHWGGSRAEEITIYSVVNTMTAIPGIKEVRLLVDGREGLSIAGHIVLDEPFRMNPAIMGHGRG
ncbi:MAG TPA: hypothetical protein GX506_03415 [Firmicutes bacterium]|nr:hypothetical protein [Bacillota bacterium]